MTLMDRIVQYKSLLWIIGFLIVIAIALGVRYPRLDQGHEDEVHTIGRSLHILYTGELNPGFFKHPTGTMYLCVFADILALASISRETTDGTVHTGSPPLQRLQNDFPNPTQVWIFKGHRHELLDAFNRQVRTYFVMLIPLQIVMLAYMGWRLGLLAPALAASLFLALSPANIKDSVYVSVNNTAGTFFLLAAVLATYFASKGPVDRLWKWYAQLALIGLVCGLSVACKYNAGVCLLIPLGYAWFSCRWRPNAHSPLEHWIGGSVITALGLTVGFTLLTPYWFVEFRAFVHDVLFQVWYFQTGHADWNTFEPGWEMAYINLRCLADNYAWLGLIATLLSCAYLAWSGFFLREENRIYTMTLIPVFAATIAFLYLMSRQAVFFDRNNSLIWSCFFFCCAASWWFAVGELASRLGAQRIGRIQFASLAVLTTVCLLKAHWLDIVLNPNREWWR